MTLSRTARHSSKYLRVPEEAVGSKKLPRHSFELRQQALAIFKAGGSFKNCARTLGIPLYTARDWHRSFLIGTFRVEHGARQQSYTEEQKKEVLRLRNEQRLSYNAISLQTKVNRATVLQWIHKAEQSAPQKVTPLSKLKKP